MKEFGISFFSRTGHPQKKQKTSKILLMEGQRFPLRHLQLPATKLGFIQPLRKNAPQNSKEVRTTGKSREGIFGLGRCLMSKATRRFEMFVGRV